jgi:hypothetical protein
VGKLFAILFFTFWIGIWSACTLTFDVVLSYGVLNGVRALAYPSTVGTVTVSKIEKKISSDGDDTYLPVVEYDYQVGGQKLHSGRIHSLNLSGMHSSARETIRRYPKGKLVQVYYHPAHPEQALLERGIQPLHLFLAMFMTPFNLIWLGSVWAAYRWLRPASPDRLPYGAFYRDRGMESELRIYQTTPLTVACITLFGGTFAGIFIVGLGSMALPTGALVYGLWTLILLAAAGLFCRQIGRATLLKLDRYQESLAIYRRGNPFPEQTISQSQLQDVGLQETVTTDSEGDESIKASTYLVYSDADGESHKLPLVENWSIDPSEQLARWLKANFFKPSPT